MFLFKDIHFLTDGQLDLVLEKTVPAELEHFLAPTYYFEIKRSGIPYVIGKIEIRVAHNELTFYAGNIGYEIYPPYRGNHYAGKACEIIKRVAQIHGMNYLHISCLPTNIASNKTCENLGANFLGSYLIPFHNELYLYGIREMNVYEWPISSKW